MIAPGLVLIVSLLAIGSPMPWLVAPARFPVTVQGTSDCPTPAEVAAVLPGVLPPQARDDTGARPEVVSIDPAGPDLMITVCDEDGAVRLSRRLARSGEPPHVCAALAQAVAVVIATWRMERSSELSLLQPGVAPPPPFAIPAGPPPDVPQVRADSSASAGVMSGAYIAAGVGTSVNQAGVTGTAELALAVRPRDRRLGIGIALAADMARDQVLEGGSVSWRRLSAGIGPCVSLLETPVAVELRAQLLLGHTSVDGHGYDSDRTDHVFSAGFDGAVRLIKVGSVAPFLELGARAWLAPQDVVVIRPDQTQSRLSLPQAEARLTAGLQFSLGT